MVERGAGRDPVTDPVGEPVPGSAPDSERARVEERLRHSETLRRIAGSVARVGGWSFELGSGVTTWAEEMYDITGFAPPHPPRYRETLGCFPPAARQLLIEAMEACGTHAIPYDLELPFTRPDGREIWVRCVAEPAFDATGRVVALRGAMQDVTAQRAAVEERTRLAERLTATMNSITDALYTVDPDWRFTYVNPHAEALLAVPAEAILGEVMWEAFPGTVGTELDEAYRRAVTTGQPVTLEEFHYPPLGLWLEVRAFPSASGLMVVFRDISERRAADAARRAADTERRELLDAERRAREQAQAAQAVLEHQATHDALTGLPNRRELIDRLSALDAGATLLLVDLDGFKRVNEALGREAGDELLMSVAVRVRDLAREADLLARVGGDKFAVLLARDDVEAADLLASRLLEGLRAPVSAAGQRLYVTAGVGLAHVPAEVGGEQALRDAEVALYGVKAEGPNQAGWYDPRLEVDVKDRLATAAELHDALVGDQFVLHFQPSFELATGRIAGAEALARWQHPDRGLVPPGLFIPVAEDTGLIEPLGGWALSTAVATARPWTHVHPGFVVWVNVAVHQLRRTGLARRIEQLLDATGTRPEQLGIEITESALAEDAIVSISELEAISSLGVRIAIDDFGTGYSSLARLAYLPVDVLKIDRSFIRDMHTGQGFATVEAIVGLAHAIGASTVAEGVETPGQLAGLREAGCDHVSGFLLARPTEASRLLEACTAGSERLRTPVSAVGSPGR